MSNATTHINRNEERSDEFTNTLKNKKEVSKIKLVPELRFKEFDGDYSKRILKDFTKINQGLQIPISERYSEQVEGSYFYITNEFLRKGSKKSYFIKNPTESVICTEEEILMTRTGNTGQVVTGVHGAFHNNFFKIKFDETCEKWYLYFFLTSYITQHKILTLAGTSTIPDLNHGDFYKLKITMPKYPEQQKIASFLSAVDEKIQQLTKKKALLEDYKKGVMQQLFSGQLRFKAEGGKDYPDWEEKKLSEVLDLFHGYQFRSTDFVASGLAIIKISNVIGSGLNLEGISFIDDLRFEEFERFEIKQGDILMSLTGNIGRVIKVGELPFKVIQNYRVGKFIPFDLQILSREFTKHLLMSDDVFGRFGQLSNQSAQANFGKQDMDKIHVTIPNIEEQQKIATYLSRIDTKIEAVNNQITQTQTFKKGLLQQLFV